MKKIIICFVSTLYITSVYSQCLTNGNAAFSNLQYYTSARPGDRRIIDEISRIESIFNVRAEVMYSTNSEVNAKADPTHSEGYDGTIIIFDGLLKFLDGRDYLLFSAILAHEYGHILQFKTGFMGVNLSNKQKELFADYLSGVYMFYRIMETNFNPNDNNANPALHRTFNIYSMFGNELGDDSFGASDSHGSSKERTDALWSFWHDNIAQLQYIMSHRAKIQNEYFYSIILSSKWYRIGEYYYPIGLNTIDKKFRE